jgi:RNA polymerase sigma factor (sigma-70 family)
MDELSDSALVDLAKAGEAPAFAQLCGRHFGALYDFVARLTRDREETEAIVRDSVGIAMDALGGLQKGASFRAWLFAIARKHALDAVAEPGRAPLAAFEDGDAALHRIDTSRLASAEEDAEAEMLAPFVWHASAALDPKQLSVLDLHLRQDLGVAEIADLMGVTRKNADVILTRLKSATADSISVALERQGAPAALLVPPLAVFAAFAAVEPPAGLQDEVLQQLLAQWPGPAVAAPAGEMDSLPAKRRPFLGGPSAGRLFGGLGLAAVLLLVLLLVPASPIALTRGEGEQLVQAQANATTDPSATNTKAAIIAATRTPTTGSGATATASPTIRNPTPVATSDAQVAAGASATSTPSPAATPSPRPTLTPTPSPTAPTPTTTATTPAPCRPSIGTASITDLTVTLGGTSNFPLFNQAFCASVSFTAAVADGAPWLSVDSAGATIPAGHSATINVRINAALVPTGEGLYSGTLILTGPNNTVSVSVTTQRGGQPPQIVSHSASCSAVPGSVSFQATAIDDIGVTGLTVNYTLADGQTGNHALVQSGGAWGTSFEVGSAIASYSLVASDGGGHESAAITGRCQ